MREPTFHSGHKDQADHQATRARSEKDALCDHTCKVLTCMHEVKADQKRSSDQTHALGHILSARLELTTWRRKRT
jgi:hypothetical protein